jgi:hypothetical protein
VIRFPEELWTQLDSVMFGKPQRRWKAPQAKKTTRPSPVAMQLSYRALEGARGLQEPTKLLVPKTTPADIGGTLCVQRSILINKMHWRQMSSIHCFATLARL